MKIYRTARGRRIDMSRVVADHAEAIAVTGSSVRMNARGDILGRGGRVAVPVQQRSDPERAVARAVARPDAPLPPAVARRAHEAVRAKPAEVATRAARDEEADREAALRTAEATARVTRERAGSVAEHGDVADVDVDDDRVDRNDTNANAAEGGRGRRRRKG